VLVVHPSIPVKTVKEFIALGRAKPAQLTYSSSGIGGSQHLAGELFQFMTGARLNHISYKGGAPAEVAVVAGEVAALFDTVITALPFVKAGRLRPLGVTLRTRSSAMPDVPTIAEAGVPGYELDAWQSIVVPAGTPREIINKIHEDTKKVLAMPDVRYSLIDQGTFELIGSSPDEFAKMLRSEQAKYAKLIKDTNIPRQ
jgi:tripartite-type tricarboxylate transporter receptor subunit TctC